MNLSQIEAFCTIANTGSVSEAARQLDCNRTKLSMAIKALEKELNVALFVRAGNYLTLSEAGKAVYKDCESLLITHHVFARLALKRAVNLPPRCGSRVMIHSQTIFGKISPANCTNSFPTPLLIWFWPPVAI